MAERKTWTGGCHCGRVRYEFESTLDRFVACNCSICQKRGSILTFVPQSDFRLLSGEDVLTDYLFNKKVIHHLFCSVCGIGSYSIGIRPDGVEMVAINARCVDGVDVAALNPHPFDGKSL